MSPTFRALSLAVSAFCLALPPVAEARGDLAQEYDQVRKIALRDRRVREAFDRANERLDEKIVELDPMLAGYVKLHASGRAEPPPSRETPARPAPKPAPKPVASANQRKHTVAAGETLSSIAAMYETTVRKLEAVNHIEDARKLRAGQVLVIP